MGVSVDLPKSSGSSRRRILLILNIVCGHHTAARRILSVLSIASWGVSHRVSVEMTAANAAFVYTVRYSRYGQPINDCSRPR